MTDKRPDDMPDISRDYDDPSYSELVPIKSSSISLFRSPLFYVVAATGILTLLLFSGLFSFASSLSIDVLKNFGILAIAYLLLMILVLVFLYSRTDKPFWAFLISCAIVTVIFLTPLLAVFFLPFRIWLPQTWFPNGSNAVTQFIGMFFGAGLAEELLKAVPALIGAWLVVKGAHLRANSPKLYDWMSVRGPLDGMLMGVFAGATFIFFETGFQYFPGVFAQNPTSESALKALMLLIPRVTQGLVGHMCWAGIVGYFIGLVVIRPNAWKYAIYGWVGAAAIHASWNTYTHVALLGPLATIVGGVVFVACFLKAKQLDQKLGRQQDGFGSIIVQPTKPNDKRPASPAPAPKTPGSSMPANGLFLQTGSVRLAVSAQTQVDFDPLQQAGFAIEGIAAEVTTHPTRKDVMGLKNIGLHPWQVTLRDGSHITLKTGRNIRLAAGVKIDIGNGAVLDVFDHGA